MVMYTLVLHDTTRPNHRTMSTDVLNTCSKSIVDHVSGMVARRYLVVIIWVVVFSTWQSYSVEVEERFTRAVIPWKGFSSNPQVRVVDITVDDPGGRGGRGKKRKKKNKR